MKSLGHDIHVLAVPYSIYFMYGPWSKVRVCTEPETYILYIYNIYIYIYIYMHVCMYVYPWRFAWNHLSSLLRIAWTSSVSTSWTRFSRDNVSNGVWFLKNAWAKMATVPTNYRNVVSFYSIYAVDRVREKYILQQTMFFCKKKQFLEKYNLQNNLFL